MEAVGLGSRTLLPQDGSCVSFVFPANRELDPDFFYVFGRLVGGDRMSYRNHYMCSGEATSLA